MANFTRSPGLLLVSNVLKSGWVGIGCGRAVLSQSIWSKELGLNNVILNFLCGFWLTTDSDLDSEIKWQTRSQTNIREISYIIEIHKLKVCICSQITCKVSFHSDWNSFSREQSLQKMQYTLYIIIPKVCRLRTMPDTHGICKLL